MMKTTADADLRDRFWVLLELFIRNDVENDQKNVILREIWQDKLWQYDFRSLRDFVNFIHIHLHQFFKRVNSAKIHLEMLDAGLVSVVPRGLEMDLLIKLPPEHRLAAWRAVIKDVQQHGRSYALVRHTLAEYTDNLSPVIAKYCQS